MEYLRRADRSVFLWTLGAWLVLAVVGAFWAFPHVEDELDEEALGVESYVSTEGAVVEWNGRDGYLQVPEGTPNPEQIAADLADIQGTRDVEIEIVPAVAPSGPTDVLDPAVFSVTWDGDERQAEGVVPEGEAGSVLGAFGLDDGLTEDAEIDLDAETRATVIDTVAPLVGTDLIDGRLEVDGRRVTVTGTAPDVDTAVAIAGALDQAGAEHRIAVEGAVEGADPARFEVAWDGDEATQTGAAPTELTADVESLGVDGADTEDGLVAGDNVAPALQALAPLVGDPLISGQVTVDDDVVTIVGRTANAAGLAAAESALADLDGVDLQLSGPTVAEQAAGALADIDLEAIEFVSGTATPTAETLGILDEVATVLADNPDVDIDVVGHTDNQGAEDANLALSTARAEAVVAALAERGIDEARMTAEGRGEAEPVETNETSQGRQRNRRVEIEVKERS